MLFSWKHFECRIVKNSTKQPSNGLLNRIDSERTFGGGKRCSNSFKMVEKHGSCFIHQHFRANILLCLEWYMNESRACRNFTHFRIPIIHNFFFVSRYNKYIQFRMSHVSDSTFFTSNTIPMTSKLTEQLKWCNLAAMHLLYWIRRWFVCKYN